MHDEEKIIAAKQSIEYLNSNSIIGLGSGSTTSLAIKFLGEEYKKGNLKNIQTVASSIKSEELAKKLGIPLIDINKIEYIDVTIDGADEFDPYLNMIKGGGGALVREKIIASLSNQLIIIVDSQKQVPFLGKFALPVEVMQFSVVPILKKLENFNLHPKLRKDNKGKPFISDNLNYIIDLHLGKIKNPIKLNDLLNSIPGIIDNGLFINYASKILMGKKDKVIVYE